MKFLLLVCCLTFLFQYSSCANKNTAPFGNILGVAQHTVVAYSNGDTSHVSNETNSLYGINLGLKWQAVEYARRFTILRKGATFSDVQSASDMWTSLSEVERVLDNKKYSLKQYPNGSPSVPTIGSYLIYQMQDNFPSGHVAVIVGVTKNTVQVAEQNFDFNYWQEYYAREIPLVNRDGAFYIEDKYVTYGWLQITDEKNELKAMDLDVASKIEAKTGTRSSSSSLSISSLAFVLFFSIHFMFN